MKLSDVMSAAHLSLYAEIGLCIFLGVFIAIAVKAFWPGQGEAYKALSAMPLDDSATKSHSPSTST
jgi:cbb3-type cytochrome oxidase subunit 3